MKSLLVPVMFALMLASCGNGAKSDAGGNSAPAAAAAPDEGAAVQALRQTNEAQATYFRINRRYALTFDELVEAHLLSGEPSAAQTGYEFTLRPAADAQTYKLSADPAGAGGARHFFTDQTDVIRFETGKPASADSPATQ